MRNKNVEEHPTPDYITKSYNITCKKKLACIPGSEYRRIKRREYTTVG